MFISIKSFSYGVAISIIKRQIPNFFTGWKNHSISRQVFAFDRLCRITNRVGQKELIAFHWIS